ncbi:MAG: GntR family transcriptional regulator [Clostridia bacterium]|jgi:DNA-binding GntR family transcriptional regulator|nr:GntR family transcriptional regulator [Clostridia bacterium]
MRNESLADKVFAKLESDILEGKYKKGDVLTEIGLSNTFEVSRTPIREAIRRLEQENLVTETGKGITILGISKKDLSDIYDIRMRIEGLACHWAAKNITQADLDELGEILDLQEFYSSKQKTNNLKNTDSSFHDVIYRACDSAPLMDILAPLHKKIQMQRKSSLENAKRAHEAVKEHREIYNALLAHDADLAEKLMIKHLSNAKENLFKISSI